MKKQAHILFQGDSITDGARGRSEDPNHILGHGYVFLIAARLGAAQPELEWRFSNRGVSGNRVVDLFARWREDTLNLRPDVLSILIGVNDVGAELRNQTGVPTERYAKTYRLLLEEAMAANPELQLVLGEPFVLSVGAVAENWSRYQAEVAARAEVVAALAQEFAAVFVPFQRIFDEACDRAPASYWIWDGVHPTYAGHQLMADAWLEAVSSSS